MLNTALSPWRPAGMNYTTDRDGFAMHSARFTHMVLAGMGLINGSAALPMP